MNFLRSHLIMNPPLSVDHFQSFATANPPKSDDWNYCQLTFVYNCVFRKDEKKTSRNLSHSFHILKMNAHFEKELHFENERTFRKRTTF